MALSYATSGTTPKIYPGGLSSPASPTYAGPPNNFIPQIWSGKLIEKFYQATVLAAISNTDYEGEIKNQGDTVIIRQKPTITISDYLIDGELNVQRPSSSAVTLVIDKAKYFNVILDDVMDVQSDINMMNMWSDDASQQFKITIDSMVLLGLLGQAAATNRGATAGAISTNVNLGVAGGSSIAVVNRNPAGTAGKTEVIDLIVRMGQVLDENNIPESGRWLVIPAWMAACLKQSELRDASLTGDGTSVLRNGRLGMIDRFTLYVSNLLPKGVGGLSATETAIYAGTKHALTFASQINKVESMRSEHTFGQLLRGLQVFGFGVLDGKALAQAIVSPG